ncbi:ribosomal protein L23 domain protein [Ancylostoma duodenale]|uniref:Ribosomal protein L23 domain protein n=1 Tax=Ancylostoma duodenale TaxID=51022 RepID=A0A0C2FPL5_9BILA|nr:ribosomal protein L23 domain protein [Ancylostoma duodenale]
MGDVPALRRKANAHSKTMAPPKAGVKPTTKKALNAKKKVVKGNKLVHKKKIRTSVHFRRPKTLKTPRAPK